MSASLVGSEMCIRDRSRPFRRGRRPSSSRVSLAGRRPCSGRGRTAGQTSCLLYTSPSPRD
eukprot:11147369-Alexandrium_andersonii.AAC.1